MEPVVRAPQMSHILEKFRHRSDKMNVRETFPLLDKVIERFSNGRKGGLISEKVFSIQSHPQRNVRNHYSHFFLSFLPFLTRTKMIIYRTKNVFPLLNFAFWSLLKGTIHSRLRHFLGGEGSKICQICQWVVVKNCRREFCPRFKWMSPKCFCSVQNN